MNNETLIFNINLSKGDFLSQTFNCIDFDLSTFTSAKTIIKDYKSDIILDENNITTFLNIINNAVLISSLEKIVLKPSQYFFEIEISNQTEKFTIIKGELNVNNAID